MFDKILYFVDNYTFLGGAANTLLRQAILMKHFGKAIQVAVSGDKTGKTCEDYINICQKENIPVYKLDFVVSNRPDNIDVFSILECYEEIEDFIRRQSPDIVHSVQLNPTVEFACRTLRIPHVMDIYQAMPEFFVFQYADIFSQYHICDSEYYASFWHRYLGTKSYCVRTVAAKGNQNRREICIEKIRFICVGSMSEWKNQMEVIKAFELALDNGIKGRLQFWGNCDSEYAGLCGRYIADHNLQDYITINGFTDNMDKVYQDSDVLICGSRNESYPNVISEAFAYGMIIITTPVAGVPEVVKDKENGYLCKGYTAQDIANGIGDFYGDVTTGRINRIINNAERTYQKRHSYEAVTYQLVNVYEEIQTDYKGQGEHAYKIEEFAKEFKDIKECLLNNPAMAVNEKFIKSNLWKIYYVIKALRGAVLGKHKKLYIWGTGKYGRMYKEIMCMLADDIGISGFIDSFKTGSCMGYKIFSPNDIWKGEKNVLLIGLADNRGVMQELDVRGYQYGTDYFVFGQMPW